jgi:hypothetical protein
LRPLPKTKQSSSLGNAVGDFHAIQGDQPGFGQDHRSNAIAYCRVDLEGCRDISIMALPLFRSLRSQKTPETAVAAHRAVGLHKPPAHIAAVSALAALGKCRTAGSAALLACRCCPIQTYELRSVPGRVAVTCWTLPTAASQRRVQLP